MREQWQRARALAAKTPASRNRYADFLRAVSIGVVVFGHWLVAAPFLRDGALVPGHMLALAPWTRWLTLAVQVMPIFFLVGGYSNAAAWQAARREGTPYARWLTSRLHRLLLPVLPVLGAWIAIAAAALCLGTPPEWASIVSQTALVPTWFLAVYVMIALLVPVTHAAWRHWGLGSFAGLVTLAALTDAVALGVGPRALGYLNYAWVWLAIHQLGYAWQSGRLRRPLAWAVPGAAAVAALVGLGPYPLAMVGVPGEALGNTTPPTLALLALGIAQTGLVLALERRGARLLARESAWTATVLVNGMIMTVYLWHMTAMLLVQGAALALGGIGLELVPDGAAWWATRPLWMAAYAAALLPLAALFARFERPSGAAPLVSRRRLVAGASLACAGLYLLARGGLVSATGGGLRLLPTVLPLVGTGLAAFGPLARWLAPRGNAGATP